MGLDSSGGIATRYGLDGSRIESRWGARFSAPAHTGPGAYPASYTMRTGSFSGCKAAGAWCWPPTPHLAPRSWKGRAIPLLTSGPSWPVMGEPLLLPSRNKMGERGLDSCVSGQEQMVGCCDHDNETSGSTKNGEFLGYLRNCQRFKRGICSVS